MVIISLDSVSKSLGAGPLFSSVSLSIEEGERIGFVGPNGCGKSTLLKLLAGRMECDDGVVARKRGLVVQFLDQTPVWESGDTIRDFLFRSDDLLVRLVGRYEAALETAHEAHEDRSAELSSLTHEMEHKGGFELERRFLSMLMELGVEDLSLPMDTLSGGMAKKAALARCLAPDSDLVLLDEPTNHLDLDTIEWLERKLVGGRKAFVLVTHDRWFLDAVCGTIMEIDGGCVRKYEGGYSDYLVRVSNRESDLVVREKRRESILRVELEWLKRGPKARGGKDKKRKERIRDLQDGAAEAAAAGSEVFRTGHRRLGGKVLEFKHIGKKWGEKEVISSFSYKLTKGERVGVVGPNGSGKSTLLDLIAERYQPDSGTIQRGDTAVVGYFDQHTDGMDKSLKLLDFVCAAAERVRMNDGSDLSAEQFLERFGFPRTMLQQDLTTLSGGELRRLMLVRLLISAPNVLLLDEPTNDFDIPTRALLEDFLSGFGGCVISVSHDRAFLEGVADSLWILDGKGGVDSYVGSYMDWREARGQEAAEAEAERKIAAEKQVRPVIATVGDKSPARTAGKLSFAERKEYGQLLPDIEAMENEKKTLELRFASAPDSTANDHLSLVAAHKRYEELTRLIEEKSCRWEALAERA